MTEAPGIHWTHLDPPAGGVARMRDRLAQAYPVHSSAWREAMLSFGLTFAVCWALLTPLFARLHQATAAEQAVSKAMTHSDSRPIVSAGAALEQQTTMRDTRFYLVAVARNQAPTATP